MPFRGFRGTIQTEEVSPIGERFGELFATTFYPQTGPERVETVDVKAPESIVFRTKRAGNRTK